MASSFGEVVDSMDFRDGSGGGNLRRKLTFS